jgi:hypothetical protein
MVVINHIVVTPSMNVDIPVDVDVIDASVNVGIYRIPIDVATVNVTPVDVASIDVARVDISPIDVSAACRSVPDSRSRSASSSCDTCLRYAEPHDIDEQKCKNCDYPSHGFLLIYEDLFLQIYTP